MINNMSEIICYKCNTIQKNEYYQQEDSEQISEINEVCDNDYEIQYIKLCQKQDADKTNNDFINTFEHFLALDNYKDSLFRSKQCLDKLTVTDADELMFLGQSYTKVDLIKCKETGEKLISVAKEWKSVEVQEEIFNNKYSSRPKLLKLWDKFSTLIIIAGFVTLLWGFIIYFGAVILEKLFRLIYCSIKKSSDEYKTESAQLKQQKARINDLLSEINFERQK